MFASIDKQNEALIGIVKQLQEMQKAEDVPQVLRAYFSKIRALDVSVFSMSVYFVLDEDRGLFERFDVNSNDDYDHQISFPAQTVEKWKAGNIIYRPNIDDELSELPPNYIEDIEAALGFRVKAVISFPYSKGLIVYRSQKYNPFSEAQIQFLSQACEILSLVIQRFKILESEGQGERIIRAVVSAINAVPYIRDYNQNKYIYLGDGITQLIGYTSQEITPEIFNSIVRDREVSDRVDVRRSEFLIECKNGEQKWIVDAAVPVLDEMGRHVESVGILYDVTHDKNARKERLLYQKLAAVGQLSAGVSHNLNNILMGIFGPAQMLRATLEEPSHIEDVETILSSATRAKELVHRLYKTTQPREEMDFGPVNLNAMIGEALVTTRSKWHDEPQMNGRSVKVVQELGEIPSINGDASELEDLVINLILNAVDAMPNGGTLWIQTRMENGMVHFTLSDTGMGMDEKVLAKIFDPFFTTKGNKGTGLGLFTLHNSVQRFGGTLSVGSKIDKGTTFSMVFPALESEAVALPASENTKAVQHGRRGSILVVEDDPGVLKFLSRLLPREHKVEFVDNGYAALKQFQPAQYDVALIDLGLPDIKGDKVATQLREIDDKIALIMMTGWEGQYAKSEYTMFDFRLQKPFEKVDELMGLIADGVSLHDNRVHCVG